MQQSSLGDSTYSLALFARPVATLPFSLEQGFLGGCQGAWLDPDRHLLEFAAEAERDLIIPSPTRARLWTLSRWGVSWACATCSKAVSGNRPIGSALQGNLSMPHRGHIFGRIASKVQLRMSLRCRTRLRQVWWALARRGYDRQKSNVPSANQPRASMHTTCFCADGPMLTKRPGRVMRRRSVCSTKLSNLMLIFLARMPRPLCVLACARDLAGSSTGSKKLPKLEGWPDALRNWEGTTLPYFVMLDTCSPMSLASSTMAPPLLTKDLLINPNRALGWAASGWVKVWLGEPDRAVEHFARAMRLSPLDPLTFTMQQGIAQAHFCTGRYSEALTWAKMALREQPIGHPALRVADASCALVGRDEEAKRLIARLLEIDHPALRISTLKNVFGPFRHPEHPAKYADALRKAGLPE